MRTCASCRDPIPETKRRDAKYCEKAACRGREYRRRQAEATASRIAHAAPPSSAVLACPCGRQYRLHITEIHAHEPSIASALSPAAATSEALMQTVLLTDESPRELSEQEAIPATTPGAVTQTVLLTDPSSREPSAEVPIPAEPSETLTQTVLLTDPQPADPVPAASSRAPDSEALTQTVLLTAQRAEEPAATSQYAAPAAKALTRTNQTDPQPPGLVTLEIYFTDGTQRRIPFANALHHERDGRWVLRPNVRFAFSSGDRDRRSLGGRPGAWTTFYSSRSPTEHDYDPDLVVMNWDHRARRGRVVSINVLRDLLGEDWRQRIREIRDGKQER